MMAKPTRHHGKWRNRWVDEFGIRRSASFDNYKDAEFALRREQTEVEEIKRGLRPLRAPNKTFNELCDYYLQNLVPLKRRSRDDESIIRVHLRPAFGPLRLTEVKSKVVDYQNSRRHLKNKTINNHLTLLITMLRIAYDKGWLLNLPKIKKPKVVLFEKNFRYLKNMSEIQRFLNAARTIGEFEFTLYAFTIFTGLRQGEVSGLKWDDIDFDNRLICVQRSFDGPTKNGESRLVPILDPLVQVLCEWKLKGLSEYVFPSQTGTMLQDSARVFQEKLKQTLDKAGFEKNGHKGEKQDYYITFHSLRHTFASLWMLTSGDIFRLKNILGHKDIMTTQRYAHLAPAAYVDDYSRLGGRNLLAENDDNIISIKSLNK